MWFRANLVTVPALPPLLLLLFSVPAWSTPQQEKLPDGPGKDTYASVCSLCHSTSIPMGKQFTRQEWELKVTEMLQEEPDVTREERAAILEYVAANFKPGGKIYINHAVAKDLQAALQITQAESEAIVRYRETQGDFKSFDDLKKISGLDTAKLESRKARLEFLGR